MARSKPSAHQRLEELHQAAASEQTRLREAEQGLSRARAQVEHIAQRVKQAYLDEDEQQAAEHRRDLVAAEDDVLDRQHRVNARRQRGADAVASVNAFRVEHAEALIAERETEAQAITTSLKETLKRVVSLDAQWSAHAQATNALVSVTPGAQPLRDGAPAEHAFTTTLRTLRALLSQGGEVPAPVPRWAGQAEQREQDKVARRIRAQRQGQAELERELERQGAT